MSTNIDIDIRSTRDGLNDRETENNFQGISVESKWMLNRCIRMRNSRGPRNVRSYCPREAGPDPFSASGIPASCLDRRANTGISLWTARFDSAKASPVDNRSARSASLPVPSCPGTVSNL